MSAALELIETVRANGGRLRIERNSLVIAPDTAALPILADLRQHKSEIIQLLRDDPAERRKPFVRWIDSACALHPRVFGGVSALHRYFCEWELAQGGVPCTRETFLCLLHELGFLTGEIEGVTLVSGLALRVDAESFATVS
jgi:hypothetical protein